ncbi:MAG: hypothetical protein IJU20_01275 [Clostridia bacterium]|nr:hypothetical protein [Clostridia bacterium]
MENIEYTEGERSYFEDEFDSNIFKPKLVCKSRKQAINRIFEMLNSASAGERFNPALRIVDFLIDHVIRHEVIVESDASAVAAEFISAMNQYAAPGSVRFLFALCTGLLGMPHRCRVSGR